ncbi:unnamed protein product [Arctogadus glacialis]
MQEGIHTYTQSGKMRMAKFAEVCSWVLTAWGKVPTETFVNIHKKTLFAPESDEEVDNSNDGSGDDEEEVGETGLKTQCSTFSTLTQRRRNSKAFQRARCSLSPPTLKKLVQRLRLR